MSFLNLRNRHFFLLDVLIFGLSPWFALMLRLDTLNPPDPFLPGLLFYTIIALLVRIAVYYRFGLYRRFWRFASIDELIQIGMAAGAALALILLLFVAWRALFPRLAFARSVLIIDGLLTVLASGGARFSVRWSERRHQGRPSTPGRRVLVVGAGSAGAMVVKELQRNLHRGLFPVAFVDDDGDKHQMRIHGVPVLGDRSDIARIVTTLQIDHMVIAMPTAPGNVIREVLATSEQLGVETKIIPAIYELLDGAISVNQLRDVDIEDLLRRDPVQTDTAAVHAFISGRRVIVTGGGGSIGAELCRQIVRCRPETLVLLGHGENSVFEIYHELKRTAPPGTAITPIIADTRFPDRVGHIFEQHRPQIVFHTAAHKHVPLMESNPAEAISNNVIGTRNLLEISLANDVERFVMISTDKAVNPSSVMGASKRVAELLLHQAAKKSGKPYMAVRFGNVLGSSGSVVLTFKRQIASGGPVTVTDPEVKRYFMTIPEAVQLVLQAAVMGQGDELFMLDMGEPVKILDLARDLIELSGLEVGRDIEIKFTGLRPGEKLFEELFLDGEAYQRTRHEKIFIASNGSDLLPGDLDAAVEALEASALQDDRIAIVQGLKRLVPEFRPIDRCAPDAQAVARAQFAGARAVVVPALSEPATGTT